MHGCDRVFLISFSPTHRHLHLSSNSISIIIKPTPIIHKSYFKSCVFLLLLKFDYGTSCEPALVLVFSEQWLIVIPSSIGLPSANSERTIGFTHTALGTESGRTDTSRCFETRWWIESLTGLWRRTSRNVCLQLSYARLPFKHLKQLFDSWPPQWRYRNKEWKVQRYSWTSV